MSETETAGKHRLVGRCLMVATLDSTATLSAARDGLEAGTISSGLSAGNTTVGTGVSGWSPRNTAWGAGLKTTKGLLHLNTASNCPASEMAPGGRHPARGGQCSSPHASRRQDPVPQALTRRMHGQDRTDRTGGRPSTARPQALRSGRPESPVPPQSRLHPSRTDPRCRRARAWSVSGKSPAAWLLRDPMQPPGPPGPAPAGAAESPSDVPAWPAWASPRFPPTVGHSHLFVKQKAKG